MLDWLADNLALIMFVTMFAIIFCGYPVAFVMGGSALFFAWIGSLLGVFPFASLSNILLRMWGGVAVDPVLVSVPMFIFMGSILERSGSAKDMLLATELLLKRVPGGLAVAVMVMGTILAAPIGVVGAAVVLLSIIALPQMLAAGYDKRLAIGTIASAGTLGILIPPAIMLVVMAEMLNTSAGALFAAATMPGFLLSGLYLVYIIVAVVVKPDWAPRLAADQVAISRGEFWRTMWRGLFPMTFLMVVVLGSIFAGWATATESAGVGVLGSFVIAALNRRLTLDMANDAIRSACRANAMVFLIFLGATGFSYVFRTLGGDDVMVAALATLGIDTRWEMLAFVMVLIFLLGFPVRVDRDLPHRAPGVRADPRQVRFLRPPRAQLRLHAVVRDARCGQSADLVHVAAVRRHPVLSQGHGSGGRDHVGRLPRDVSVHRDPADRPRAVHRVSRHHPVAAARDGAAGLNPCRIPVAPSDTVPRELSAAFILELIGVRVTTIMFAVWVAFDNIGR